MRTWSSRRARFSERNLAAVLVLVLILLCPFTRAADPQPLPNTAPLTLEGDLASQMIDGIDRFLLDQTDKAARRRKTYWESNPSADENRKYLARILGVRDQRPPKVEMELLTTTDRPALVGASAAFEAYAVRWP